VFERYRVEVVPCGTSRRKQHHGALDAGAKWAFQTQRDVTAGAGGGTREQAHGIVTFFAFGNNATWAAELGRLEKKSGDVGKFGESLYAGLEQWARSRCGGSRG
jgi:hypothetical protein